MKLCEMFIQNFTTDTVVFLEATIPIDVFTSLRHFGQLIVPWLTWTTIVPLILVVFLYYYLWLPFNLFQVRKRISCLFGKIH